MHQIISLENDRHSIRIDSEMMGVWVDRAFAVAVTTRLRRIVALQGCSRPSIKRASKTSQPSTIGEQGISSPLLTV
jgi:hypothetical protein